MKKVVDFDDTILIANYPECGPNGPTIEELYEAFKDRLKSECEIIEMPEQGE